MAGVAEAIGLVVVVEAGRKVLDAGGNGRVGNAVPVLDGADAVADVVPGGGLFDADVVGDGEVERPGFVGDGIEDVAVDLPEFDAVDALLLDLTDGGAGLGGIFGRGGDGGTGTREHGIDEDARRNDFPGGALGAEFEGLRADRCPRRARL